MGSQEVHLSDAESTIVVAHYKAFLLQAVYHCRYVVQVFLFGGRVDEDIVNVTHTEG